MEEMDMVGSASDNERLARQVVQNATEIAVRFGSQGWSFQERTPVTVEKTEMPLRPNDGAPGRVPLHGRNLWRTGSYTCVLPEFSTDSQNIMPAAFFCRNEMGEA
jgi:hypothetical protein